MQPTGYMFSVNIQILDFHKRWLIYFSRGWSHAGLKQKTIAVTVSAGQGQRSQTLMELGGWGGLTLWAAVLAPVVSGLSMGTRAEDGSGLVGAGQLSTMWTLKKSAAEKAQVQAVYARYGENVATVKQKKLLNIGSDRTTQYSFDLSFLSLMSVTSL